MVNYVFFNKFLLLHIDQESVLRFLSITNLVIYAYFKIETLTIYFKYQYDFQFIYNFLKFKKYIIKFVISKTFLTQNLL